MAALEWLFGPERRAEPAGPQLAAALWWYWYTSSDLAAGRGWLERALASVRDPLLGVRLGYRAAALAWRQGDFAGAAALAERSLAGAAGVDAGYARGILAAALLMQGQWQRAATLAVLAETQLPETAPWPRAVSQIIIGVAARESGALAAAEVALSSAQGRFALAGDRWGAALARSERGLLAAMSGDESAAAQHYAAALALASAIGDRAGAADTSLRLARLARRRGDPVTAAVLLTDVLTTVDALRDQANTALALWEAAALAPQPLAAGLAHAAHALGTALNLPRVPFQDPDLTGLLHGGPPRFARTQDALAAALALCGALR